uniref:hypothetical protein n=1 Tax=Altererythrobacter segetis TaxID=1104773 RepID=UPI00140E1B11|nr:hypothetical protein [Altererythrobacter segetis]
MRAYPVIISALAATATLWMPPAAASAQGTTATQPAHYSVADTPVGKLLDDPAANEILKKLIPTVYANDMFQTQGRTLTLKAIQQYEPDALSDENLAKIQAELDKIPAKG